MLQYTEVNGLGTGDIDFAENLIDRLKRQLKANETRIFSMDSNISYLNDICRQYQLPTYRSSEYLEVGQDRYCAVLKVTGESLGLLEIKKAS